jgi:hypothetical protein
MWEAQRLELYRRKLALELESIRLYEWLPIGGQVHRCTALWIVLGGPNRCGKSCCAAAEFSYAVLDCHPFDKYPKGPGLCWCAGLKEDHLILMYDSMFREGAFKLIKDEITKLPRAVRWDRNDPTNLQAYDEAYREKWFDAPPLIPPRMIAHHAWRDAGQGVPAVTTLRTGKKILWSSGLGVPQQGQRWSIVFFDEEITNEQFYKEAHRGLTGGAGMKRRSHGLWSATAQVGNPQITDLKDKAERDPESKLVRSFQFSLADMPYFNAEDKELFKAGYNEEDIAIRFDGISMATWGRVYPSYNPMGVHGVEPFDIPLDWCIWAVTDPGRTRCATIFNAVDPDQAFHTVYSGFEVRKGDAHEWARGMKAHETKMGRKFQGIVCDQQRGKQTLDSLYSQTVAEQYWTALLQADVVPTSRGNVKGMGGFFPGLNNVEARERALINMLAVRIDGPFMGTSKFRTVRGAVPLVDRQITQARTDPKNPEKRYENKQQPDDFMDAVEYLAAFNPPYYPPEVAPVNPVSAAVENFKRKMSRSAQREYAGTAYY